MLSQTLPTHISLYNDLVLGLNFSWSPSMQVKNTHSAPIWKKLNDSFFKMLRKISTAVFSIAFSIWNITISDFIREITAQIQYLLSFHGLTFVIRVQILIQRLQSTLLVLPNEQYHRKELLSSIHLQCIWMYMGIVIHRFKRLSAGEKNCSVAILNKHSLSLQPSAENVRASS